MKGEIDAAIAAHGTWKSKLKAAIESGVLPDIASAGADNFCAFGKWLNSTQHTGADAVHHATVQQLHTEFHRTIAGVLRDLQAGRISSAEKAIGLGTAFAGASAKLTMAMLAWKKAA
ncbi:MAG: hypothetical protein C0497_09345 [Gemmatimonas sp.]|nr:hypothetical protein [Gemmatimonas sp.]